MSVISFQSLLLIVGTVWLLVLTVMVILLIRQVGLMTVRLSFAAPHMPADEDGPSLGTQLPDEVPALLGIPGLGTDTLTLLFFSGTCSTCTELAAGVKESDTFSPTLAVVAGNLDLAEEIRDLLPGSIRCVTEPEATRVSRSLDVSTVPFALRIDSGRVTEKVYLQSSQDLGRLRVAEPIPQDFDLDQADLTLSIVGNGASKASDLELEERK